MITRQGIDVENALIPLLEERKTHPRAKARKVHASTLMEKFGLSLGDARSLMQDVDGVMGIRVNLVRGQWSGAFLSLGLFL